MSSVLSSHVMSFLYGITWHSEWQYQSLMQMISHTTVHCAAGGLRAEHLVSVSHISLNPKPETLNRAVTLGAQA